MAATMWESSLMWNPTQQRWELTQQYEQEGKVQQRDAKSIGIGTSIRFNRQ